MDELSQADAWLESRTGWRTPIRGTCFLGRSNSNHVVVADDRVSRRHAMIHRRSENDEYWLIDHGSSNGTYLNGRRLTQPTRLADMDRVELGGQSFIFHQPSAPRAVTPALPSTEKTIQDIKSVHCWLLVADMESSTQFIQAVAEEESVRLTSSWLLKCRQLVEEQRGAINKFLGDGFLAYWPERAHVAEAVAAVARALKELQAAAQPRFRMVVHYGKVFVGGGASLGEESLHGPEVNFVFRMEKLASAMGVPALLSGPAQERLQAFLSTTGEGCRPVPGFEGEHAFYSF
jgi:adenylate cyclase